MMMDNRWGIKALRVGAWGSMALAVVMTAVTLVSYGVSEPMRFVGGASVLLIGAAFWLFLKNAAAPDEEQ